MRAVLKCLGARRVLRCGGELTGGRPNVFRNLDPLICQFDRYLISGRALGARGSREFQHDRVGVLKSSNTLLAGEILFADRSRMSSMRKSSSFGCPSCFLSDSSPPIGNRLSRELGYLQRGFALFSTSAGEMTATKPVGGAGNKIQNDVTKEESADEEIADMKILHTLAKYLWLKDNLEFRFRVAMALGLLVGAKVRTDFRLCFIICFFFFVSFLYFYIGVSNRCLISKFYHTGLFRGLTNTAWTWRATEDYHPLKGS